eukprot:ANDGO_01982.mRNA.1 hypothetical protein
MRKRLLRSNTGPKFVLAVVLGLMVLALLTWQADSASDGAEADDDRSAAGKEAARNARRAKYVEGGKVAAVATAHGGDETLVYKKVHISKGEVPHVMQVARAVVAPLASVDPHKHETETEIFHLIRGKVSITVGDSEKREKTKVYSMKAGDTLSIFPNAVHALENPSSEDDAEFLVTMIDSSVSQSGDALPVAS